MTASKPVLISDYGDWLSSDIAGVLEDAGFSVRLYSSCQRWVPLRALRFLLRLFGGHRILHDKRRILEFALVDLIIAFEVLIRRPDVFVYFKDQTLLSALLAHLFGAHTVCVFGNPPADKDDWVPMHARALWIWVERSQIRLAQTLVCESTFIGQWLPAEKCYVVHSFVISDADLENVKSDEKPNKKIKVLFVGSVERKGLTIFANAAAVLKGQPIDLYAVTSSSAFDAVDTVKVLPELPRAEFLAVLRSMDAVVIPSHSDGGPRLLFEALVLGKAVICSTNCAGRDLKENPLVFLTELTSTSVAAAVRDFNPSRQSALEGLRRLQRTLRGQRTAFLRRLRGTQE